MKKYIAIIAVIFTFSFIMAACGSGNSNNNNVGADNNNNILNETNNNIEENEYEDENNDANAPAENENDDDNEYGNHDLKQHLSHLDYSDENEKINLTITDIHLGELEINEESKLMFDDQDTISTVGIIFEMENNSDETIEFDENEIRYVEDEDKPGEEPDPILSDEIGSEIEGGETLEGTLYYFEDKDINDLEDFTIKLSNIIADEEELDDLKIDVNLD